MSCLNLCKPMTDLNCLNRNLAIIGFDAQLDGLTCIDSVAAALYQGAPRTSSSAFDTKNAAHVDYTVDYATLCAQSADAVMRANQLKANDLAVIIIGAPDQVIVQAKTSVFNDFFSCQQVSDLGAALTLCDALIDDKDRPVLLLAVNQQSYFSEPQKKATISFADDFSAYGATNGICSVLLSSHEFALTHNSYCYATITSAASSALNHQIEPVIKRVLDKAQLSSELISTVEVSACAEKELQLLEENGLLRAYQNGKTLISSISCAKSVFGENGPLSQLLGLLNCVLALQQRYRPAIKNWSSPAAEQLEKWWASPFYLFNQAAPFFPETAPDLPETAPRYAAYSCLSASQYSHLILQENNDQLAHTNGFNAHSDLTLFILTADSQDALLTQLNSLGQRLLSLPFKSVAANLYQSFTENPASGYRLVLLADSLSELEKEIQLAQTGIHRAFTDNCDWKTPKGSYLSVNPGQAVNKICFLYPGIGASYIGLGRALFHLFPEIYSSVTALSDDPGASLKDKLLNPRSVVALDFNQLKARELALRNDLPNIAECGVAYACVFSKIFTDIFNIKADFAAGYSMGEVSMFAALGCWENPGVMSARLAHSATFTQQLSGELRTLRKLWNLPAIHEGGEAQIWESYNIKASAAQVANVIDASERVYLTIINSPDSVVIAGYPADCLALSARLGVRAIALNVPNAIHSAPAYQEYAQMVELYSMEIGQRSATQFYSTSCYLSVPFSKKAIAVSVAKCLCDPVDFPRLIDTLYQQGASVFIEMGAGRSLSGYTDKTLQNRPHLSVAINGKGCDEKLSYARALAKLVSFGVKANLESFFYGSIIQPVKPF
jgi:PfaB family protein